MLLMKYDEYKSDTEPFIELLCGVSQSGKSTYANTRYQDGFTGIILSRDDLVMKYGRGTSYSECWNSLSPETHKIIDQKLYSSFVEAIKTHQNIIVDMMNLTRRQRLKWIGNLPDCYVKLVRVFVVPYETVSKRNRNLSLGKFIHDNKIREMYRNFEIPSNDEFNEVLSLK